MPSPKNNKTVLLAPLDWGLGHATRCIPVVKALLQQGCKVVLAASGSHAVLLGQAFPQLTLLPLPGYGIRYGKKGMMLQLLLQIPAILKSIQKEHKWLKEVIVQHGIDLVISDNRYGLHSRQVPCVLITHQLHLLAPKWMKWAEEWVQQRLYKWIENFSECWIPDVADAAKSMSKKLSHPAKLPQVPLHYIGWLTRFSPQPAATGKQYAVCVSLSGPEPQRTLLEEILLPQLGAVTGPVLLLRGLPGQSDTKGLAFPPNVTVHNHLPATALQQAITSSHFLVSRCGYSTLMDLKAVAVRPIFIPTPGQTEQHYLGAALGKEGKAVVVADQNKFDLQKAMQQSAQLPPFSDGHFVNRELDNRIALWLAAHSKS